MTKKILICILYITYIIVYVVSNLNVDDPHGPTYVPHHTVRRLRFQITMQDAAGVAELHPFEKLQPSPGVTGVASVALQNELFGQYMSIS